ncbi:Diacylglycerol O-acyltransferase 2 [Camellia lanceoleosa]|uniref:Diacylglycerol O-acyltransferase 2 n=1 Tax=Camellia lanceoleosa TaxID=1840588 RepID=A0ACC0GBC1_9ERIC|nr:Diacylglycerol O-acyltransferase 2 [Camellia lanceoleosa]
MESKEEDRVAPTASGVARSRSLLKEAQGTVQMGKLLGINYKEIPPILRWSRWRCRPMESANIRRQHPPSTAVAPPTEFHSSKGSVIGTLLALVIWLGAIHFNVLVVVSSFLLLLPLSKFFAVLGLLVVLMLIPIDEKSRWGRKLASRGDTQEFSDLNKLAKRFLKGGQEVVEGEANDVPSELIFGGSTRVAEGEQESAQYALKLLKMQIDTLCSSLVPRMSLG